MKIGGAVVVRARKFFVLQKLNNYCPPLGVARRERALPAAYLGKRKRGLVSRPLKIGANVLHRETETADKISVGIAKEIRS